MLVADNPLKEVKLPPTNIFPSVCCFNAQTEFLQYGQFANGVACVVPVPIEKAVSKVPLVFNLIIFFGLNNY